MRNLRVRDVMTAPAVTAEPSATLEDVARQMLAERIGCVVIVAPGEPGRPVGIVTETDFDVADDPIPFTFFRWPKLLGSSVWSESSLEDVYERARGRPAESIMTAPVTTIEAEAPLFQAVELMLGREVKRLPVVSGDRLVGIVTRHDLLKCLAPEAFEAPADAR